MIRWRSRSPGSARARGASVAETVRFDRTLYDGQAVQAALDAFAGFATLTLEDAADAWVVSIDAVAEKHRDVFADELANYVLAETVAARGAGGPA